MPAHKIDFYLNSSDNLRALAHQARRVAELQQVFLKIAPPPLTQASCVKQLRAGTLFLLAGNAAVATKLKQLAPRFLTAYEQLGFEITSIRVEVQVKEAGPELVQIFKTKQLSIESIEYLETLAAKLEDCPLKHALTKMAARQRKYHSHSEH
jgi:hypothetical protein